MDNPDAFLTELLTVGIGHHQVLQSRQKSIAAKKVRAERGQFNGGYAPFGYKIVDGQYTVVEEEASAVCLAFTMYAQGYSYGEIVDAVCKLGVKGRRGSPIGENTLHYMFINPRYTGVYIWNEYQERYLHERVGKKNEDPIIKEGVIPAIVPVDVFNAVTSRMKSNKARYMNHGTKRQYLLSGLIKCGVCGSSMAGVTTKSRGHEYAKYICSAKTRLHTCNAKNAQAYLIESTVLEILKEKILRNH